jgi:hypothetical protein
MIRSVAATISALISRRAPLSVKKATRTYGSAARSIMCANVLAESVYYCRARGWCAGLELRRRVDRAVVGTIAAQSAPQGRAAFPVKVPAGRFPVTHRLKCRMLLPHALSFRSRSLIQDASHGGTRRRYQDACRDQHGLQLRCRKLKTAKAAYCRGLPRECLREAACGCHRGRFRATDPMARKQDRTQP